jgi:hypothetical protein
MQLDSVIRWPSNHMRPRAIRSDVSKLIEYLTWNKLYIKYYGYKIMDLELTRSLNKLYKLYILEYWHRFNLVYYTRYVIYYWWTANILKKLNIFIIVKIVYTVYIIKSIDIRSNWHIICIEIIWRNMTKWVIIESYILYQRKYKWQYI